jgi:beta-aspartyl-peptidase (threonine type)
MNDHRKRVVLAALIVAGMLFLSAWRDAPSAEAPKGEAEIKTVLQDQVKAWNRGDLDGFMKGYWQSDDLTFFSGKDRTQGWKATLERYRKKYQAEGKEMGELSFSDLDVRLAGDSTAWVRGRWKLEMKKETVGGLFTLIFEKKADGWRIVHDHTSG